MNQPIHLDIALANLAEVLEAGEGVEQALLIEDSVGRVSVGIWGNPGGEINVDSLGKAAGPFFSGSIFSASQYPRGSVLDLEEAWETSRPFAVEGREFAKVRRVVRFRTLTSWQFQQASIWSLASDNPVVVAFFSYKGGLGRTTSLVSFAVQRAALGDRVAILDLDLEAPGLDLLGRFCDPPPRYGIVDYLLEANHLEGTPEFEDYYRTVSNPDLVGNGSIAVFPAGVSDSEYLGKVSRIDLEWELARESGFQHPLERLFHQIRKELAPDWILVDSRTGFSDVAGLLLSGLAHQHVLFGVQSRQSWKGLAHIVSRLGEDRLGIGKVQADLILVQVMVQDQASQQEFRAEAESLFFEKYYLTTDPDESSLEAHEPGADEGLDLVDAEGDDAPHNPITLPYMPSFSQEVELTDHVKMRSLLTGEYKVLANRIARRAGREESDGED